MEEFDALGNKKRIPKAARVKNKAPAPLQITAEQLLREAKERQLERLPPPPRQKVIDGEEMDSLKLKKRKDYEDNIRKNRTNVGNWLKYAKWEESNAEMDRVRSIYERALDTDHRVVSIWLKYAEMEMRHRQINHARNIWDRAVTLLPRVNQFWYKYTYMEELMENIAGARNVFERWMEWQPEEQAWLSYIKMELRYKEAKRARSIFERFVMVHPDVQNWIRFARFEENQGNVANARLVFERAIEFYGDANLDAKLIIAFAKFEESCREYDRVRAIYKYAINKLNLINDEKMLEEHAKFEKRHGERKEIEDVIITRRRKFYEESIKINQFDYDSWFDLLSLLETEIGDPEIIRETYERAVSAMPPSDEKRHWKRYIYFWIRYAIFEETFTKNYELARQVYKTCVNLIPIKSFTFSKIWILYSNFEIRQKDINAARKILGLAIGKCPTDKLFNHYISLETDLREFKRVRILYEKYIEYNSTSCIPWIKYAEMENILGNIDRAKALFELSVSQENLNMPEILWKAYIDFAISLPDYELVRDIYERLLSRTHHSKVWISYAQFEAGTEEEGCFEKARSIFQRANESLKQTNDVDQRIFLIKTWKDFESQYGDKQTVEDVNKLLPHKVKKRRRIVDDNGVETGWEEYSEYVFPDSDAIQPNSKLLKMAHLWKLKQQEPNAAESSTQETN